MKKIRIDFNKNSKGFTIVELLVSLGIMGIVFAAIFSFFLFNYKNFIREDENAEIQYQLQMAMNNIIENVIYSEGVYNEPKKIDGKEYEIEKIIFQREDSGVTEYYIIEYETKKLYYVATKSDDPENEDATNEFADYIDYLKITPIDGVPDGTYDTCKGIEIEIKGVKGNSKLTLKNRVYFRNAD